MPAKQAQPVISPAQLQQWDLRASVAASGAASGRASLHWRQVGERFVITVAGPFGVGATRLEGDQSQVQVTRGKEQYISVNPQADLARAMGVAIPLELLGFWVRGVPDADLGTQPSEAWAWDGWEVRVQERQQVDAYLLPHSIVIQGPGQSLQLQRMRWELVL